MTVALILAAWLAVATVLALVIGRGIAMADRAEQTPQDARELVEESTR